MKGINSTQFLKNKKDSEEIIIVKQHFESVAQHFQSVALHFEQHFESVVQHFQQHFESVAQHFYMTLKSDIHYIQGVPKKMSFLGKTAITTFKNHPKCKAGGVSENSGYLLPHGH